MIRVTIWNEYRHEVQVPEVAKIYPRGIHNAIGDHLKKNENFQVRTATLDEPENGLICQHVCDSVLRSAEEKKQIMI